MLILCVGPIWRSNYHSPSLDQHRWEAKLLKNRHFTHHRVTECYRLLSSTYIGWRQWAVLNFQCRNIRGNHMKSTKGLMNQKSPTSRASTPNVFDCSRARENAAKPRAKQNSAKSEDWTLGETLWPTSSKLKDTRITTTQQLVNPTSALLG